MRKLFSVLNIGVLILNLICGSLCSMEAAGSNRQLQQGPPSDVRQLVPGTTIDRELKGGGEHRYEIALQIDEYMTFKIARQGIAVSLILVDPEGETLYEGILTAREHGVDEFLLVSQKTGTHTLTVIPQFPNAPLGRYQVNIEERRGATDRDQRRFKAQQNMWKADALFDQGTNESRLEALQKLSESIEIWRSEGDRTCAASALKRLGGTNTWLRRYDLVYQQFNEALELNRAEGDVTGEAETLRMIGMVYASQAKNQDALKLFNQAEALQKNSSERWQAAMTYSGLATTHWRLGQKDKMDDYFKLALHGLHETGDIKNEAGVRTSWSFILLSEGNYQFALDNLLPSLELFRVLGDVYGEAVALNTLGAIYYNLGAPQKALEYLQQSFSLAEDRRDLEYGAPILSNQGIAYHANNELNTALVKFEDALARSRKSNNPRGESIILGRIGRLYSETGELPIALEKLNQRLRLSTEQKDPAGQADARSSIGEVYLAMGDHKRALDELNEALKLRGKVRDRHGEAVTLLALAKVKRELGTIVEARNDVEKAIDIIETIRGKVVGVDLRISYLAAHQRYYELLIDLQMRLHEKEPKAGHDAAALQTTERARARALLESLAEARAEIREGVSPDLLQRERLLGRQLNAAEERRIRTANGNPKPEDLKAADSEVEKLLEQLRLVQAQIRGTSSRYAAVTQPQPLNLKQIQAHLDSNTLLLSYSLGNNRSFLFAVSKTSFTTHVLPKRGGIEAEADEIYRLVKDDVVETYKDKRGVLRMRDHAGMQKRRSLAQVLLGPVARRMPGKRLLIIPDGKLQYVPFASLPKPGTNRLLVHDHEIVTLPSVSVLDQLRRDLTARARASKSVIVFADPVYSLNDERFKLLTSQARNHEQDLQSEPAALIARNLELSELQGVSERLHASGDEANEITKLAPPVSSKILGFDASLPTLTKTDLRQYRIVHFATHGWLNSQNPELSGVVLSLYDQKRVAQDGFLRAHEIYNLKLNADLVVLSACQTAIGKEVKGEGLMGLGRAFMYAGSPRVVVTLWKVDDVPTAEFMKHFYTNMMRRKMSPAAALRAAQGTMAGDQKWSSPKNWSGFVLQGEWR